ncbi:MAG: plasmid encoded RepA protein [Saprospiraceae bacterium]|nr:plasmid encoded RepA protein [Saprospiraceae bacterium]
MANKNIKTALNHVLDFSSTPVANSPTLQRVSKNAIDIVVNPATEKNAVFQHSILCQTFLPYKNPGEDVRDVQKRQGRAVLSLEAGSIFNPHTESFEKVGLPYGAKARLILSYISTQAVRQQNPVVDVANSMTAFIKRIGLNNDGVTIKLAKEQLKRLAATRMSIGFVLDSDTNAKRGIQTNLNLIQSFDVWFSDNPKEKTLWNSTVKLSDEYFNSLINHAIPLDERALAALSNNALALDTYSWLAQRLHRVQIGQPEFVHWEGLKEQFGEGYADMFKFKQKFRQTLQLVLSQYKDAKIEEVKNKGFHLKHSPTPIPFQPFQRLNKGSSSDIAPTIF